MIEPTDIWRAANMMIELYGQEASIKAAVRADGIANVADRVGWELFVRRS